MTVSQRSCVALLPESWEWQEQIDALPNIAQKDDVRSIDRMYNGAKLHFYAKIFTGIEFFCGL
jgi:hypothetical protein